MALEQYDAREMRVLFEELVAGDTRPGPRTRASIHLERTTNDVRYIDSRTQTMFEGFILGVIAMRQGLITFQEHGEQ